MLARRFHVREWWDRRHFELWTSAVAEVELRAGTYHHQDDCLRMVRRLRYLPATSAVRDLKVEIVRLGLVPPTKEADAAHLAMAATHSTDFLLTWNYAHLANAAVQSRLEAVCEGWGLRVPLMVSPESIPQVRFGQSIRKDR